MPYWREAETAIKRLIEKFWEVTKECQIALVGKDRREGIIFGIDFYTDVPKIVGFLVERLLSRV